MIETFFLLVIVAYCVGSVPCGYLVARWCGVDDIRQHGSGNIGATNVARFLGIKYFFLVFFLDAVKAYSFLKMAQVLCNDTFFVIISAAMLFLGNAFSLFLEFKGGKGVATAVGIFAALSPWLLGLSGAIWLGVLALTRTVGVASVAGLLMLPCLAIYALHETQALVLLTFFIMGLGVFLHRSNIKSYLTVLGSIDI